MSKNPGKSSCNWIVQQWICASKVWELLPKRQGGIRHFRNEKGTGLRFSKGGERCFMFAVCAFKIQVSIILIMIQWSYQLTKQNWLVCELGTVLLLQRFWFWNLPSGPKSFRAFRETGPWGRVNFRKDFWDCYWRQGKSWPMADQRVPSNDPWKNFTTHFGSSFLLFSANCIFLSPA